MVPHIVEKTSGELHLVALSDVIDCPKQRYLTPKRDFSRRILLQNVFNLIASPSIAVCPHAVSLVNEQFTSLSDAIHSAN